MADRRKFLGLLVCVLSLAFPVLAVSTDVCPANSQFKSLPFLKAGKPGALKPLIANGFNSIDMTAVTAFIQKTLVPMIGANVFFFALAALFLVIFILWRLLRYCCFMICCKSSCDKKRADRNPHKLLFNKDTKVLKGCMCLLGLVAVAFAIYGMASVKKDITDDAFAVIKTLGNYINGVTDTMDRLMGTISGVSGIIDDFQAIIENDLQVDALMANLTDIGSFLDASDPTVLQTDVNALKTSFNTKFENSLTSLNTAVTIFNTDKASMDADIATLTAASTDLNGIKATIDALQTAMAAVDFTNNFADAPGRNMAPVQTAVNALNTGEPSWSGKLSAISTAITDMKALQTPPINPFTKLIKAVDDVLAAQADVVTKISSLKTKIHTMTSNFASVPTKIAAIMANLDYVNATVIALTGPMVTARSSLASANSTLGSIFSSSPSPDGFADLLVTFTTTMQSTGGLTALRALLVTAETDLNNAPYTTYGTVYKAWLTTVGGHITTLGTLMAGFKTAVDAYVAAPAVGTWDPLSTNAAGGNQYTAFKSALDALSLSSGPSGDFASTPYPGTAAGSVSDFATQSTTVKASGDLASAASTAATTFTGLSAALSLPAALTSLEGQITTITTAFAPFGGPPSSVVQAPTTELASIKSSAITTGNSVKASINDTIGGVRGQINNLKDKITGQLGNVEATYKPTVRTVDGYRYSASMALYGVSILFVLLILLSAYLNYHFGANFSTFWLLIITVLYFLLALIIALLVAVLYLGCGEIEPMLIQVAPASFTPLLNYYFGSENTNTSVKAVLKNAGIIDIDATLSQVTTGQANAVQGLTSGFTFRAKPLAVIARINTTLDGVNAGVEQLLNKASREELIPVYSEVKGLVCCMVPDIFASMWTGLTFAGVFAFALIFCTFFFIGKIDQAPRKDCCGCTCHTAGKYAGTVYPDTLPQFNLPGFDHPLGPYDAPMNGAMWAGEGGEAHVMVSAGMANSNSKKDY